MLFSAREYLASPWLDLAEDRLRLDRLSRNAVGSTFFPWASPIPREARKSHRRHPPLRSGPRAGASSIVLGLSIAIEAAVVAGSKTARRSDMANIGSFKKSGQEFQGEIVTLSLQTKGVRIVPEDRTNDNAPSGLRRPCGLCGAERYAESCRLSAGFPRVSRPPRSA